MLDYLTIFNRFKNTNHSDLSNFYYKAKIKIEVNNKIYLKYSQIFNKFKMHRHI